MSKISELSDGGSLLPTDFLIAVRSGGNVKVQADQTEFDRIRLGDNEKIELGNSQDISIYWDGSVGKITNNIDVTGNVTIPTGSKIAFDTDGQTYITEDQDERMRVWVANTEFMRLTNDTTDEIRLLPYGGTTYTGGNLDVTGTVTADGLTLDSGTATPIINLTRSGTHSGITFSQTVSNTTGAGADLINYSSNNDTGYVWQTTDSGGTQAKALLIAPNRDISFYEDTGTTAKLFWDASAESLGIGTSSPAMLLD